MADPMDPESDATRGQETPDGRRARADDSLRRQRETVLARMLDAGLLDADLKGALAMLTEAGADLMHAEWVSVWSCDDDYAAIRCLDRFERASRAHSEGQEIRSPAIARYIHGYERGGVIALPDVLTAAAASEFLPHLRARDVRALLSAPIWSGNRIRGLFSYEGTGAPRAWSTGDEDLCTRMATLAALCFEVDGHRRSREALRRSEQDLRRILEASPLPVSWADARGTVEFWNRRAAELFGYEAADVRTVEEWFLKAYPDPAYRLEVAGRWNREVEEARRTGADIRGGEVRVACKDGSVRTVEVVGTLVGERLLVVFHDVTGHRQALEALRESEASLETAQSLAGVGSWDLDVATGQGRWSRQLFRLFGFDPAQGAPHLDEFMRTVHPDDRAPLLAAHRRAIETGERGLADYRTDPARGPVRYFATVIDPVKGPSGRVARVIGAVQDLTERKRLEAQLLRAQRLESVGTLASGVAHDLNNVLSPIVMGVEMLSTMIEDAEARAILATMQESARRGTDTVRQLLTFARGAEPRKRPVRPRELLEEFDRLLQQTFPKNIRIYAESAGTPATVLADSSQLHQVLMNLCVNARDAMPDGGVLFLTLENRTLDESSAGLHPKARPIPYVVFKVSDSGTGIPPEIFDRVFDPFFSTKAQGRGTGMGLATVLGIVEGHGGFVLVDSKVGEGTTFQVFIPASEPAQPAEEGAAAPAVPTGRGELVLIVDDEAAILRVAENVLRRRGYSTMTASSTSQALECFERNRGRIRAVLTDIMMPFGDGRQLIRALRRAEPGLPVIAMSGLTSADAREQTIDGGASAFLGKPFTADELLAVLGQMLPHDRG